MGKPVRQALCHPDRKHKAKDLCKNCYNNKHSSTSEKAKAYKKAWNLANQERLREYQRNRPKDKDKARAYYLNNPEKVAEWTERRRERIRANPERARLYFLQRRLKKVYGMTLTEYNDMVSAQGGVCAICKKTCSTGRRLSIDHDHETGLVRGLLCDHCNNGLARFKDNPESLIRASEYLNDRR